MDLQKSYDSVEWPIIEKIVKKFGFPQQMGICIMTCIRTVRYVFVVNGVLTYTVVAKRGLRQGDSISLYIFILLMENLSWCLAGLQQELDFNYHPRCKKMHIAHLCFVDDLLMFTRGDLISMNLLRERFDIFSEASGLKAYLTKSQVYFGGVKFHTQTKILEVLGYERGDLPFSI